jgi:hypothetical protein
VDSSVRDCRTVNGVARPCGQSPGSGSLPQRTRSEVPSLHRRYPASTVVWTSPTPQAARPVPHGRPVGPRTHDLRSPVLRPFSVYRHARATTPAGSSQGSRCSPEFDDGGLPQMSAGSAPALNVSRPAWRSLAFGPVGSRGHRVTLSIGGFGSIVTSAPLRLLLAGATVARWDLHPLKNDTFTRRTDILVLPGA